jgi:molybdenum cofactor guanylyltransferase
VTADVSADWVGAVLTGGASTRMGRDKAAIEIDGRTMAGRVAAALREAGAADVACIGGATGDVPDDYAGAGPLGGIVTAARWAGGRSVVVAPCDLVEPDASLFVALAAAVRAGAPAATPAAEEPLPLAVAPATAAALRAAFDAGERSVHRALAAVEGAVRLDLPVVDADTPAELPPGAR